LAPLIGAEQLGRVCVAELRGVAKLRGVVRRGVRGQARASLAPSIRPSCMPRPNLTEPLASMALSTEVGGQRSRAHVFMSGAPGWCCSAAESGTLAGPHGRTAASHWALGGLAARPECAAQPGARSRESQPQGGWGGELWRQQDGTFHSRHASVPSMTALNPRSRTRHVSRTASSARSSQSDTLTT